MSGSIRAFIALEIPDEVRSELAAAREAVVRELPAARWTRPSGWHLTLKFLGESDRRVLEDLVADLEPRLSSLAAVEVRPGGGGFFPSPARPRVAWIGGAADGAAPVAEEVDRAAAEAGFDRLTKRWALHLTMARLKRRWPTASVERYLDWAGGLRLPSFTCSDVVLFSSRLEPGGAVYTALERIPLE